MKAIRKLTALGITEINIFSKSVFISAHSKKQGWFRIFGIGMTWKHQSVGLLFSERCGNTRYLKIGNWILKYLPPIS